MCDRFVTARAVGARQCLSIFSMLGGGWSATHASPLRGSRAFGLQRNASRAQRGGGEGRLEPVQVDSPRGFAVEQRLCRPFRDARACEKLARSAGTGIKAWP